MKKINILFLSLLLLAACSKDDNNNGADKSNAKAITAFVFAAADNDALTEDIKAEINEDEKTITAAVPSGTDVKALKPTLTVSDKAKTSPGNKAAKDFRETVEYTVTAEDGSEAKYVVTVTIGKSDAKAITSFEFLKADNDKLSEDVEAEIDEVGKTILARVPLGTDVTALKPSIGIPESAKVSPGDKEAVDFSEAVTYTVTAEDGTETTYTVEVEVIRSDRQVLIDIYNANPNNNFGWDLEDDDITNWEGVTVENGRVTALKQKIAVLPPSIGDLTKLKKLEVFNAGLTSIPSEIGKLLSLEVLDLQFNALTEFPDEIGQLINLQRLIIDSNPRFRELPSSLGNLINLKALSAFEIELTTIPDWIDDLENLESLNLGLNNIEVIPNEIGSWKNLDTLYLANNKIKALPAEIGNLTGLKELGLTNNELKDLPQEFGNLKSLTSLSLGGNDLTEIPQAINELTALTLLSLFSNKIATIDPDFFNLENLENLSLSSNALTTLPKELGQLSTIRVLNLRNNALTSIPAEIGNLDALKTLNLRGNMLTSFSLPFGLARLTQLEYLYLQENQITVIPPGICTLPNLIEFQKDDTAQCNNE